MDLDLQPLQEQTDQLVSTFRELYGSRPQWLIKAPGRVNLIGEHTDYNLLPVLPMTINRKVRLLCRRRADHFVQVANVSDAYPPAMIDLSQDICPAPGHWTNYIRAALHKIKQSEGVLPGMDVLVESDLPAAAGLSSSSALVIASCLAALQCSGINWSSSEIAQAMTEAEQFVGTAGGGMDQTIIAMGRADAALLIEFAPLRAQPVQIPDSLTVYIIDSGQKAEKSGAAKYAYNRRSLECRLAVAVMSLSYKKHIDTTGWQTLRDVYDTCKEQNFSWAELLLQSLPADAPRAAQLEERLGAGIFADFCRSRKLDPSYLTEWAPDDQFQLYARAAHVLSESDRVFAFRSALLAADLKSIGHLANASHASCRDLYHISTPRLENLAGLAMQSGALGVRITGAGFGGCLVAFVRASNARSFAAQLVEAGVPANCLIEAKPGGQACATHL